MKERGLIEKSKVPAHLDRARLRRAEASQYLEAVWGVSVARATLAKWATVGGGPPFQKFGRAVLYPVTELDAWAANRLGALRVSTSDGGKNGGV